MDKPLDHYLLDFLNSPEARDSTRVAESVATLHASGRLSHRERVIADDILRLMTKAVEVQVREALAEHLKHSQLLPRDVAMSLARDVESVSIPILGYSQVLTDDDLVAIVRGKVPAKQVAVAGRARVSSMLSEALARDGDRQAVLRLVGNEGADIRENAFGNVLDRFGRDADIGAAVVRRPKLPVGVAGRLVGLVSESLKQELVARHRVSPEMVNAAVRQGGEGSVLTFIAPLNQLDEVVDAVRRFHREGKLTPTLVLRALCLGQLDFFETALAIRGGQPIDVTRRQIMDSKQFPNLFRRAGMPAGMLGTYVQIMEILAAEIEQSALLPSDVRRTVARLIDRPDFDAKDLEQLLSTIEQRVPIAS